MNFNQYIVVFLLIVLSACGGNQTIQDVAPPTVAPPPIIPPTVAPPTVAPPAETVLATATLPPPIVVEPTAVVAAEAEVAESSEMENEPLIVLSPVENGAVEIGQALRVEGVGTAKGNSPLTVSLRVGATELASAEFVIGADGQWGGDLQIPYSVAGEAILIVNNINEEVVFVITLALPEEPPVSGTAIQVTRPTVTETLVSGYTVFLEGLILNPIDNTMTIGLLMDNCSTFVASQSFSLGTAPDLWSGWNGQLILPGNLKGEGCIVAYTGEYRQGDWREVQIPVVVVGEEEEDEDIRRVVMNGPAADLYAQGDVIYFSGLAIGTSTVDLQLSLEATDVAKAKELLTISIPVDDFGFWEANLQLPAEDAVGNMLLKAAIPDDEEAFDTFEFEVR